MPESLAPAGQRYVNIAIAKELGSRVDNPAGTDFARSDDEIELSSLRLTANWRF